MYRIIHTRCMWQCMAQSKHVIISHYITSMLLYHIKLVYCYVMYHHVLYYYYVDITILLWCYVLSCIIFLLFLFQKLSSLILEREEERETSTCCSTYVCIHWLLIVCALTGDQTHNLSVLGQRSNKLSYPARALLFLPQPSCNCGQEVSIPSSQHVHVCPPSPPWVLPCESKPPPSLIRPQPDYLDSLVLLLPP